MKKTLLGLATILLLSGTHANALTFDYNTVATGGTPQGTLPWLTANFEDVSSGIVKLTMEAAGLVEREFVGGTTGANGWFFNFTGDATKLTFTFQSGDEADVIDKGSNAFGDGAVGLYDIRFGWDSKDRLTAGEQVVYEIAYTGAGTLTASWFDSDTTGSLGAFQSAAHVQGITGTPDSSKIVPGTPVPEPTTMLLFGTGLIGLAGLAQRKNS